MARQECLICDGAVVPTTARVTTDLLCLACRERRSCLLCGTCIPFDVYTYRCAARGCLYGPWCAECLATLDDGHLVLGDKPPAAIDRTRRVFCELHVRLVDSLDSTAVHRGCEDLAPDDNHYQAD